MTKKAYINNAEITKGQFPNECAVTIYNHKGKEASGFFEREHIKKGRLEVKVLDEKDNLLLVKVPGRIISGQEEAGSGSYITVKKEDISFE